MNCDEGPVLASSANSSQGYFSRVQNANGIAKKEKTKNRARQRRTRNKRPISNTQRTPGLLQTEHVDTHSASGVDHLLDFVANAFPLHTDDASSEHATTQRERFALHLLFHGRARRLGNHVLNQTDSNDSRRSHLLGRTADFERLQLKVVLLGKLRASERASEGSQPIGGQIQGDCAKPLSSRRVSAACRSAGRTECASLRRPDAAATDPTRSRRSPTASSSCSYRVLSQRFSPPLCARRGLWFFCAAAGHTQYRSRFVSDFRVSFLAVR